MGVAGVPPHDAAVETGVLAQGADRELHRQLRRVVRLCRLRLFRNGHRPSRFSQTDKAPTALLLATFAVFAMSFIVRPLGGAWGHFGDSIGGAVRCPGRS